MRPEERILQPPSIFAKITGHSYVDSAKRKWAYAWKEVRPTFTGDPKNHPVVFAEVPGGLSCTCDEEGVITTGEPAFNLREVMNGNQGFGIAGNGVDQSAQVYPPHFHLMPAPNDVIVRLFRSPAILSSSVVYCWLFEYENSDDGADCGWKLE